ncbi:MAG: RNA 2',3'-cyclic phosphodiesterase [Gammaproteobacteria bacterium]|nr:RNA 2',3'-cyclic phosphodiesterase [Gammaproteobacteria bacterium]
MSAAAVERLFFAVWPTEAQRAAMADVAARLALDPRVRRIAAEEYHVTVAFVGEVPAARIDALIAIGAASARGLCTLQFDAYEYWPKPEVVVAAARQIPASLERLWRTLHERLGAIGCALDPKRLRPHVTLARGVADAPALPSPPACAWQVAELCLMRSARGRATPAYTVVARWPLLDEPASG